MSSESLFILGVSGSPRKQATEYVLRITLEEILQSKGIITEQINLRGKRIEPCNHCNKCRESDYYEKEGKYCIHDDDMERIYPKILKADGYVFASPVYGGNMTGLLKNFFDRLRPINKKLVKKEKIGGAIAVGGSRSGGQDFTLMTIVTCMMHHWIIPIPSSTWESALGPKVWSRIHDPQSKLTSGELGAKSDQYGLDACIQLANRIVKLARIIKAGKLSMSSED